MPGPGTSAEARIARHLGDAYALPVEKNGYAPGWFRAMEYMATGGSNWCSSAHPSQLS